MNNLSQRRDEFEKYFSDKMLQHAADQCKLAEWAMNQPIYVPPQPWYKKLWLRTRWAWWDFRIWLSKKIYDWSDYEDQY